MINLITQAIKPTITALPFVEHYGGLAVPFSRQVEKGKDTNGKPIYDTQIYPVTYDDSFTKCFETGTYKKLIPTPRQKSLFYWEQLSVLSLTEMKGKNDSVLQTKMRLIGWVNIPKLNLNNTGATDITISHLLAPACIKALNEKTIIGTDSKVEIDFIEQQQKSMSLFNRYTYGNENFSQFTLRPYDFFGLDFNIKLTLCLDSVAAVTLGTKIECITL